MVEATVNSQIEVDGSMGEGGGQLFRMSMALAYILNKKCTITKIRANRARGGGLSNQHLTGLNSLMSMLPNSYVDGNKVKSTDVIFDAGDERIETRSAEADCKTPGAITLIMQMLMPCLLFNKRQDCTLSVRGGTFVSFSPPMFTIQHVLLPMLQNMGAQVSINIKSQGFMSKQVGKACVTVNSLKEPLKAIDLTERGALKSIDVYAVYTENKILILH